MALPLYSSWYPEQLSWWAQLWVC